MPDTPTRPPEPAEPVDQPNTRPPSTEEWEERGQPREGIETK